MTNINVSNFDISQVTNLDSMFYNWSIITSLVLSNFVDQNVNIMHSMFWEFYKYKSINWDNLVSNVTKKQIAFRNCYSLKILIR